MSTPTPRTDSEEYPEGEGQSFHVVSADFARTLERELAAAQAECERLKFATEGHLLKTIQQQAELARLRAQNDQFSDNLSAVGKAYNAEKDRAEKAETELACEKENRNHLIEKGAKLETELTAACSLQTLACRKLDAAEIELATERAIVSRIWVQLGSPTYADLKGRSIYDLIDEIKTDRAEVERLKELLRIESASAQHALAAAERAEAELSDERARLDWLLDRSAQTHHSYSNPLGGGNYVQYHKDRAAIDAAMKP